jgi:hypothetical protein
VGAHLRAGEAEPDGHRQRRERGDKDDLRQGSDAQPRAGRCEELGVTLAEPLAMAQPLLDPANNAQREVAERGRRGAVGEILRRQSCRERQAEDQQRQGQYIGQ